MLKPSCTCWLCTRLFFSDSPPTEIYTLSLHDALPIYAATEDSAGFGVNAGGAARAGRATGRCVGGLGATDRKSTRLNSSHGYISYAVFCLKKKKWYVLAWDACRATIFPADEALKLARV